MSISNDEGNETCLIEGWTSGNSEIDNFIKDTIYNAKYYDGYPLFLEWVPFDRFEDIKQIGEGGFAKVYSATWMDGISKFEKQRKKRGKLHFAPIEQLTEFNVSEYLQNLPCGLLVGQAVYEIPKYQFGLIRAVRRTRKKKQI